MDTWRRDRPAKTGAYCAAHYNRLSSPGGLRPELPIGFAPIGAAT